MQEFHNAAPAFQMFCLRMSCREFGMRMSSREPASYIIVEFMIVYEVILEIARY